MKKLIKVGHIDRAPDVYRVAEKDEIEITIQGAAGRPRRSFTLTVEVAANGLVKVRGDGQIVVTPMAGNLVSIEREV